MKIRKLEWIEDNLTTDLTVWFEDSEEPFSVAEFKLGSSDRERLEELWSAVEAAVRLCNRH